MKKFIVNKYYSVTETVTVIADNEEEAIQKANELNSPSALGCYFYKSNILPTEVAETHEDEIECISDLIKIAAKMIADNGGYIDSYDRPSFRNLEILTSGGRAFDEEEVEHWAVSYYNYDEDPENITVVDADDNEYDIECLPIVYQHTICMDIISSINKMLNN